MGVCASTGGGSDPTNERVQQELVAMHQADQEILKLLLLGTGECGKVRRHACVCVSEYQLCVTR